MSLLLHVCCAPCLLYPLDRLSREGLRFSAYFYNPNIHPYREFKARLAAVRQLAEQRGLSLLVDKDYGLQDFLRRVVFHEQQRCHLCYRMRLEKTAQMAAMHGHDAFSTTLLYSRYQNHALIEQQGRVVAEKTAGRFFYLDFRQGWQEGIDEAQRLALYRQSYCGCVYSEQERYDNQLRKKLQKDRKLNV